MSHVSQLTTEQFSREVLLANQPVVVDFFGTWCPPCRALAPILDTLAGAFSGQVKVVKVNVDEEPDLAERYQIRTVPTLLFFSGGRMVDRTVGVLSLSALRGKFSRIAAKSA